MRDATVLGAFQDFEHKVGNDIQLILRTVAVVETRQRALEAFLLGGRLHLLKLAFLQLVSPGRARAVLLKMHTESLKAYNAKMDAAYAEKQKAKLVRPGLVGVVVLALAVLSAGCVSRSTYQRTQRQLDEVNRFYGDLVDAAANQTRRADFCEDQQKKLIEVLKRFNQIDERGQLRKGKSK